MLIKLWKLKFPLLKLRFSKKPFGVLGVDFCKPVFPKFYFSYSDIYKVNNTVCMLIE